MSLHVGCSRDAYRELCEKEPAIPLFSQAWWLDAASGTDAWDVVLVSRGAEIVGALPFVCRTRFGFKVLAQPQLSQTLGPWVRPSQSKYAKMLAYEKDVLQALADHLPQCSHYAQNWHHSCTNWLPFFWRGYAQTTYYTYIISNLTDEEKLWEQLQENIRSDIRKARDRFGISVRDADLGEFLTINRMTFARQGKRVPYPDALVERLDAAARGRNCRRILVAQDPAGRAHAAAYIVWDANTAYYLMGGGSPDLRSSGAGSLCLWRALLAVRNVVQHFDFEGSMLESVERFFRGFGARQVPYFRISRTSSTLYSIGRIIFR
jgi:Acetyltransferase (GNAT) domain